VKQREIGNFIAINLKFIKLLFETLFQIENNCVTIYIYTGWWLNHD
jgi:HKD family nuclease